MGGVSKLFPLEEAVVLAVRAGADILLASNNSPNGYEENLLARIYEALVKALEKRLLSPSMITSAYARIQELKNRFLI
jgi:beta-glucosidase-like glycosyl hydrolase